MVPVILYEDNHLLIVDKPPGILTQPSGTQQNNLEDSCKDFIKKRDKKPGNVYLHAVHRLDKAVGGIVLFAKSHKALTRLNTSIRQQSVKKEYEALIEGRMPDDQGSLEDYLFHDKHQGIVVEKGADGAKLARLKYKVMQQARDRSLIAIELETGRYHQIRVQFSHAGHPIFGDSKYGSKSKYDGNGIALIHKRLTITHPVTKEPVVCFSKQTVSIFT